MKAKKNLVVVGDRVLIEPDEGYWTKPLQGFTFRQLSRRRRR